MRTKYELCFSQCSNARMSRRANHYGNNDGQIRPIIRSQICLRANDLRMDITRIRGLFCGNHDYENFDRTPVR